MEYKGLGIHGSEWLVIELQPHETKAYLKDLQPDAYYLLRIGKSRASTSSSSSSSSVLPSRNFARKMKKGNFNQLQWGNWTFLSEWQVSFDI